MTRLLFSLLLICSVICLPSCASRGPSFDAAKRPSSNSSLVYVYRPSNFGGGGIKPGVKVNSQQDFVIPNNTHAALELPPGKHSFSLVLSDRYSGVSSETVDLKAGQTTYLRVTSSFNASGIGVVTMQYGFSIDEVDAERGLLEISKTSAIDPKTIGAWSKSWLMVN